MARYMRTVTPKGYNERIHAAIVEYKLERSGRILIQQKKETDEEYLLRRKVYADNFKQTEKELWESKWLPLVKGLLKASLAEKRKIEQCNIHQYYFEVEDDSSKRQYKARIHKLNTTRTKSEIVSLYYPWPKGKYFLMGIPNIDKDTEVVEIAMTRFVYLDKCHDEYFMLGIYRRRDNWEKKLHSDELLIRGDDLHLGLLFEELKRVGLEYLSGESLIPSKPCTVGK